MRHNALRDTIANMLRESGCNDVRTEPLLLPVDPNNFSSQTNVADGARLDISARGVHSAFDSLQNSMSPKVDFQVSLYSLLGL